MELPKTQDLAGAPYVGKAEYGGFELVVAAVAVAIVQLVLDITYTIIDPRTRVS